MEFPHGGRAYLVVDNAEIFILENCCNIFETAMGDGTKYITGFLSSDNGTKKALPILAGCVSLLSEELKGKLVYGLGQGWSKPEGSMFKFPTKMPHPERFGSLKKGGNIVIDATYSVTTSIQNLPDREIDQLLVNGYDHVRFFTSCVDLWTSPTDGRIRTEALAGLLDTVKRVVSKGMSIVICPDDGSCWPKNNLNTALWQNITSGPYNYNVFIEFWKHLIGELKAQSWWNAKKIFLEVLNEPGILQNDGTNWGQGTQIFTDKMNFWLKPVYEAIRLAAGSEVTIIVPLGPYNSTTQFIDGVFVPSDENWIFPTHWYPDDVFMNQGTMFNGSGPWGLLHIKGLPWGLDHNAYISWIMNYTASGQFDPTRGYKQPGDVGYRGPLMDNKVPSDPNYDELSAQIAYRRLNSKWQNDGRGHDLTGLEEQAVPMIEFCKKHGTGLWCGEYGPTLAIVSDSDGHYTNMSQETGNTWIRDVTSVLAKYGVGSCRWMYKLSCTGTQGSRTLIPEQVAAIKIPQIKTGVD